MKKLLFLFLSLLISFAHFAPADTTTPKPSYKSNLFVRLLKNVYLNPSMLLITREFKLQNGALVLILPDANGDDYNDITGVEKAMKKLVYFLLAGDDKHIIPLYFNPKNAAKPFSFVADEVIKCKFNSADRDSIEALLVIQYVLDQCWF